MKPQTSNPSLQIKRIHLLDGDAVPEGSPLRLTMELEALREVQVEGLDVELVRKLRYGYGRGTMYGFVYTAWQESEDVLASTTLPGPGALSNGSHHQCEATLDVPVNGPPTLHGSLIESAWYVRLRARISGADDIISDHPITVQSSADTFRADSSSPELLSYQQTAWMEIQQLSTRILRAGESITGELRVRALRHLDIRSIRVELLLCETVDHGPGRGPNAERSPFEDRRDTESVISTQDLDGWKLGEGETVVLPFTLQAPSILPAPSLDMPNFHVWWLLRATLNVPMRTDPRLDVGLTAVTH
ncbi:MAG: hypothetical protein JWO93_2760 [Micrococcaceae bacterium]|nr:hypothetical protein [Micrococcaceae bacterium]